MTHSDPANPAPLFEAMRKAAPLVHCITNYVAMNFSANVLLAAGASPAMVHSVDETAEFAAIAGALTINIGTLSSGWLDGMIAAANGANQAQTPWVLDPVAHFATGFRRAAVRDLMNLHPAIIRGNASEIIALAGGQSAGRGVDSGDDVANAEQAARQLARSQNAVIAVTGAVDFITDGRRDAQIAGGSAMMPKITAMGCSLTALIGAYSAVAPHDPFGATIAALTSFAIAGEDAARHAAGPGSFMTAFVDALYGQTADDIATRARISIRETV